MSRVSVVARIVARPDSVAEVEEALFRIIGPTRDEPGCVEYTLHREIENPAAFVFYEIWESERDLDAHMESAHFAALGAAIGEITEEIVVRRLTRLE